MQRAVGHFFGRLQNEGVAARGGGLELAELGVVDFGVSAQLAQIGAHQGQVVFQIDFADGEDALHCGFVAEFAAERVAGVGGVDDDSAVADDVRRLLNQAFLGVVGVDGEKLCHK